MDKKLDIKEYNRLAWDKRAISQKCDWTLPVSSREIANAKNGKLEIFLTPVKTIPSSWFPPLKGCKILCLASGGGQQGPLLAAAGAEVTVLDNSPQQLDTDNMVAKREGLSLKTIVGDMCNLSVFPNESFDLIIHPVSNLFVSNINLVWQEAYRVLKPGGLLLSGFNNPVIYLFDSIEMAKNRLTVSHKIPYSPFNEDAKKETELYIKYGEALEFGHTLEEQIGGQIAAGFVITGFYEDNNRPTDKSLLDDYLPIYMATKAVKVQ